MTNAVRSIRTGPAMVLARHRVTAVALFAAFLALYLTTLQPGLSWGDGIKIQQEAITGESFVFSEMAPSRFAPDPLPFAKLGVAAWDHPLYVMLVYGLTRLVAESNRLWVVNAWSALTGSACVAMLFSLCYLHTKQIAGSLLGALFLGLSHTFWFHSVTPEVYGTYSLFVLVNIYFYSLYETSHNRIDLAISALALGLAISTHLLAVLLLPVYGVILFISRRRHGQTWLRANTLAVVAIGGLVGCLPFLLQLIRMLRSFSLAEIVSASSGGNFTTGMASIATLLSLPTSLASYVGLLLYQFGPIGVVLGAIGFLRGRHVSAGLHLKGVALYLVYVSFGLYYRVVEQFAHFQNANIAWAILIASGFGSLTLGKSSRSGRSLSLLALASVVIMPVVYSFAPAFFRSMAFDEGAFGIPNVGTTQRDGLTFYLNPPKPSERFAEEFGQSLLRDLPSDAVVLAQWWEDTDEYLILRYYQEVMGARSDIKLLGWATLYPDQFDVALATAEIRAAINSRPVYLASYSDRYYGVEALQRDFCITPEHNLYRVYPRAEAPAGVTCLP